jgi:colanic acid/amylovoran biosynthesis glycosyltransferase
MKIAYITTQFPCGPGESFLQSEVRGLAELSGEVVVIPTLPVSRAQVYRNLGAPVIHLGAFEAGTFWLAAGEFARAPRKVLAQFLTLVRGKYRFSTKRKNIAIFPKALAVAATIRREGVEHIHASWLSTPATVAHVASELTGVPWSVSAHRYDIFQDNLLPAKVASAQFVRVISARNRTLVVERAGSRHDARCRVVHLGVPVPSQVRRPEQRGVVTILCAARLLPVKGHEYLIRALAIVRARGISFRCDLAGDGPLRASVQLMIAQADLREYVQLRGHVEHDRLVAELESGKYDIAVLASTESGIEFEGIPVSLMEAMAAGVPCVATQTGSISELIDNQTCSRSVPQRDPLAMANAIVDLSLDPRLREEAGKRARARVEAAFDTSRTTRELFELMCAQ